MTATTMTPFGEFCQNYLVTAATAAAWGKWFLVAGFAAGTLYALIEAYRRWKTPVVQADGAELVGGTTTGLPIKDLADALRELVAALAAAPVWLGMVAAGIFALWVVGAMVPDKCAQPDTYRSPQDPAPQSQGGK